MEIKQIYKRWRLTLEVADTDTGQIKTVFKEVVNRYCKPHRFYHNLDHVGNLLYLIETTNLTRSERSILIHAALFHDVIYNLTSSKNERLSAEFAHKALNSLGVPTDEINKVCQIIEATANHSSHDFLTQLFLDMDLAILGYSRLKYKAYSASIRKEWSHISNIFYCIGRTQFLIKLLLKKSIFYTSNFQRLYEIQARNNIKNELINMF